jgi:hypothetical protein
MIFFIECSQAKNTILSAFLFHNSFNQLVILPKRPGSSLLEPGRRKYFLAYKPLSYPHKKPATFLKWLVVYFYYDTHCTPLVKNTGGGGD